MSKRVHSTHHAPHRPHVEHQPEQQHSGGSGTMPPDSVLTRWVNSSENGQAKSSLLDPAEGLHKPTAAPTTGSPYVDKGLACEEGKGKCFLDPARRQRVVTAYEGRVNAAQANYVAALTQLGLEELLKKEPEQSEWVLEVMLDVIGMLTSKVAVNVFRMMRGGQHAIEGVIMEGNEFSHELESSGEEVFTEAVGQAVSLHKKSVAKPDEDATRTATQKSANIAYLDLLKDQSALIYESIREGTIAGQDDATLLVFFESFRAANGHTVGAYKAALNEKLERFVKSGVGKLGVTNNNKAPLPQSYGIDTWTQHETHAFWVKMPSGPRLGLYKRGYEPPTDTVHEPYGDRFKTPIETVEDRIARLADQEGFIFQSFVPTEFVEAAVKMQTAKWGYAPLPRDPGPLELSQMGARDEEP